MTTSANHVRVDPRLVNEAARILGARSRTEAVQLALRKIIERKQFSRMMTRTVPDSTFEKLDE
jgi:Arc/MetJ family transcription regulator